MAMVKKAKEIVELSKDVRVLIIEYFKGCYEIRVQIRPFGEWRTDWVIIARSEMEVYEIIEYRVKPKYL